MKAYKRFNKDMTCRGFQYAEGKTYETDKAAMCMYGFHACENPLDCSSYYSPAKSVIREVELEDVSPERHEDSKVVAKKITIGAQLDVMGLCKAHFEYVTSNCTVQKDGENKNHVAVSAGENGSAAAGNWGSAAAGYKGSAAAGENGSAAAGENGSAAAGNWGSAAAGYKGSAAAGENGSAAAGENGIACVRGGKVKGGMGCLLAIAEIDCDGNTTDKYAAGIVDGKTLKPDTWYISRNGEFVEDGNE